MGFRRMGWIRICKNGFPVKRLTKLRHESDGGFRRSGWNLNDFVSKGLIVRGSDVSPFVLGHGSEMGAKKDEWNALHSSHSHSKLVLPSSRLLEGSLSGHWKRSFLTFPDGDEEKDLSRHHEERRILGYSKEQLYAVVAGVDMYQDFVPWCQKSSILWRKGSKMEAELQIGFQLFNESYTSFVELDPPHSVKSTVSKSVLFHYLNNLWEFDDGPYPNSCNLHFKVDFQFRSSLYRKVADLFFEQVVAKLVSSFEKRCLLVYGPSSIHHAIKQNV